MGIATADEQYFPGQMCCVSVWVCSVEYSAFVATIEENMGSPVWNYWWAFRLASIENIRFQLCILQNHRAPMFICCCCCFCWYAAQSQHNEWDRLPDRERKFRVNLIHIAPLYTLCCIHELMFSKHLPAEMLYQFITRIQLGWIEIYWRISHTRSLLRMTSAVNLWNELGAHFMDKIGERVPNFLIYFRFDSFLWRTLISTMNETFIVSVNSCSTHLCSWIDMHVLNDYKACCEWVGNMGTLLFPFEKSLFRSPSFGRKWAQFLAVFLFVFIHS